MSNEANILTDSFGREHTYLRISLTERCNLRCTYCMPQEGVPLSPKEHLMQTEEIYEIAKLFVEAGVTKIRLTGGEPLVRKDFPKILEQLSALPAELSITSNGIGIHRHFELLKKYGVKTINLSLDTLQQEKFKKMTFRDYFEEVYANSFKLLEEGFGVKINVVLMKGVNDGEIAHFIALTKEHPFIVRFIEFMPFDGNQWNREKTVSYDEILAQVHHIFGKDRTQRLQDAPHDTTRNFKIEGYEGNFGIIGTVTNPFCDTCNRVRLTANGQLKNCLFSGSETDLLTPFRKGKDIKPLIQQTVWRKKGMRAGLATPDQFNNPEKHHNRSMIKIGG